MIHIEKNQEVAENKNLKVAAVTGDYEDTALIEFYDIGEPKTFAGAFQAQYVRYGGLVYKFNDPKELGEEILRIDPESTHSAASFAKMSKELLDRMNNGSLNPSSLDQEPENEQVETESHTTNSTTTTTTTIPPSPTLTPAPTVGRKETQTPTPALSDVIEKNIGPSESSLTAE